MLDTVIHNGMIITVDESFTVIPNGAVAIDRGRILRVWTPDNGDPLPAAEQTVDARGGIVMPGLVNAHTHLPMSLFRGLADDLPLQQWLNEHIFPAEARYVTSDSVSLGARLSCAEMLLGGITTCCDGYFMVSDFFQAVADSGMRAILGQGVIDFPAPGVPDPALNVDNARKYAEAWRSTDAVVQPAIFCHSPYTCSARTLTRAKEAATAAGVLLQIHVAETSFEREQISAEHGCTPVGYLDRLGILDQDTLLVHAVWVDADDIEIIARSKACIVHCPESNMKLAAGVAPAPDFTAAGIPVGLGTDGCASNNNLDLWAEMDTTAKLHKVYRSAPTVMDAETVLRMATIDGARALGMAERIGSLETGKRADLIVLDLSRPHLTPMYHPASHLVYTAGADDVRHVMVDGRWVVRDHDLQTIDLRTLFQKVNDFVQPIANKASDGHD